MPGLNLIKFCNLFIKLWNKFLFVGFCQLFNKLRSIWKVMSIIVGAGCFISEYEDSHRYHFLFPNTTAWKPWVQLGICLQKYVQIVDRNNFRDNSDCHCRKYQLKFTKNTGIELQFAESQSCNLIADDIFLLWDLLFLEKAFH
jgi:hypothetical protein